MKIKSTNVFTQTNITVTNRFTCTNRTSADSFNRMDQNCHVLIHVSLIQNESYQQSPKKTKNKGKDERQY